MEWSRRAYPRNRGRINISRYAAHKFPGWKMDETTNRAAIAGAAPTKVRWSIFVLLLVLLAVNYIDRTSLAVAMPLIAKEFNIEPVAQGILLSAFYWTYAVMQIPGGMLTDKFGARKVVTGASIIWGLFQAVAAVCTGWSTLLLTRLGLGVAES